MCMAVCHGPAVQKTSCGHLPGSFGGQMLSSGTAGISSATTQILQQQMPVTVKHCNKVGNTIR